MNLCDKLNVPSLVIGKVAVQKNVRILFLAFQMPVEPVNNQASVIAPIRLVVSSPVS